MRIDEGDQRLILTVDGGPESDLEEIAELTGQLRDRLLELEVEAVDLVRIDDIPEGAKPAELITIGALSVLLAPGTMKAAIELAQVWLRTRKQLSRIRVTMGHDFIDLMNPSDEEQRSLVRAFVARHTKS